MRAGTVQGFGPAPVTISVRNNNASAVLVDGQAVYFDPVIPATDQISTYGSVDVKSRSEATAGSVAGMFAGIIKVPSNRPSINVGEMAEAVVYGFTDALVTRRTRATTTDPWAAAPPVTAGDQVAPESTNNRLIRIGPVPPTQGIPAGSTGQTITAPSPVQIVMAQDAASIDTAASSLPNGAGKLNDTYRMKVFVRAIY